MRILVPTDFSHTSETAFKYAISFCKNYGGGEILILHAYREAGEHDKALAHVEVFSKKFSAEGIAVSAHVTHGKARERIGDFAEEHGCNLVIMASHGARGLQRIIGSRALRTVAETDIPFIVTQREVYDDEVLDKIAVPITLEKEDKKILATVASIANALKASVVLIYRDKTDEFLSATIARNLNFAKSYLRNRGVATQSIDVGDEGPYDESIVKYAAMHKCDLIATVNHHNQGILNMFGTNFDQNLLENHAHIPVLTVNAKSAEKVNDIFTTTR